MVQYDTAWDVPASDLPRSERAAFITRTYGHLLGAIMAFVILELVLFRLGWAQSMAAGLSRSWLLVLGGFVLVSWLATRFANTAESLPAQYAGLGLYVAAEAVLFAPLLVVADRYAPGAIGTAATISLLGFAGLTAVVFATRRDFSFLRSVLIWGGVAALLLIVGGVLFGFHLGLGFSVAMVALAGASILYDTSNVLHHYPVGRHVAAALALFASVALLFFYVLRILLESRR